jgi:tetratricopeptide (TPR) repeat protein
MGKRRKEEELVEEVVGTVEQQTDKSTAWFEKNKGLIMGLIGLLVLLTAAFIIFKFFIKEPKEKAAKAAIYQAEQRFAQDSFALALDGPGLEAEGFLDIIDNYGGTKTANLAKLYAGISYLNLGRFDDAISYLDSHSAAGAYSPIMKFGNLGDAYSEKGDFGKAISMYQKATTASEDALLTPYYLYKLGLLARRQGDNSTALNAFSRIKNKYPNSNEGETIDMMIRSVS